MHRHEKISCSENHSDLNMTVVERCKQKSDEYGQQLVCRVPSQKYLKRNFK